jgi:hypothetical protein
MAAVNLLPASLQNTLQEVVERTNQSGAGIRVILLSTTEGVPLGRVYASDQPLNEEVLASIESVWAPASKQIPVLGLEKVHQVTAIYDHGTLIHVYQAPVVRSAGANVAWILYLLPYNNLILLVFFVQVVTILCGPQTNLGAVRATAIPLLKQTLEPLCTTLVNSLNPPDMHEANNPAYYQ